VARSAPGRPDDPRRFFGECDRLTEQLRDAERQAGALRAEVSTLRELAARPGYWFCVPCWTRAGGFSLVDDQATLFTLAKAFRAGVFPDCEASETARCGTCADGDGRALRVRGKLGSTAAREARMPG
jgi:hypothetical protein